MNAEEAQEEQLARALTEPTAGEQEQRRKRREEIRSVWASTPSASTPAAAQTPTPLTIQLRASASGLPERSGKEEALVQESPERTPARTPSPSKSHLLQQNQLSTSFISLFRPSRASYTCDSSARDSLHVARDFQQRSDGAVTYLLRIQRLNVAAK
jgi:hypothetical protein